MIITRKVKFLYTPEQERLIEATAETFRNLFNFISKIAWTMHKVSRFSLHHLSYHLARKNFPNIPSEYVITAINAVSSATKSAKLKQKQRDIENKNRVKRSKKPLKDIQCPIMNNAYKLDLDARLASIHEDIAKITIINGRFKFSVQTYPYILECWRYKRQGCQLLKINKQWYLALYFEIPEPEVKVGKILGIDRGINNIAVCSNNTFFNSKKLKKIKSKFQYNRSVLQSKGTKSAKRKLKSISRKENRFVRDVNHCISKKIVNSGYQTIVLEKLDFCTRKNYTKVFNKALGNWSWSMLGNFLKYKSAIKGINLIYISPQYTSQRCSQCGNVDRESRKGHSFQCKKCRFQLHSDLNAARNIAFCAKSAKGRLLSISPTVKTYSKESLLMY